MKHFKHTTGWVLVWPMHLQVAVTPVTQERPNEKITEEKKKKLDWRKKEEFTVFSKRKLLKACVLSCLWKFKLEALLEKKNL